MAMKYCAGKVPEAHSQSEEDRPLVNAAAKAVSEVEDGFRELALHKALIAIWEFISVTNKYIVEREPWKLAQDAACKERLDTVVYNLLEALRVIAILISPFMPGSAQKIVDQIGITDAASQGFWLCRNDNAVSGQDSDQESQREKTPG